MLDRSFHSLTVRLLAALLTVFLIAGCANGPEPIVNQYAQSDSESADIADDADITDDGDSGAVDQDVDPIEPVNRFIFAFNDMLDTLLFQPAAATYRVILPDFARDAIRSFLRNLRTPVILANDLFQGSWGRAEDTVMRFLINTTVGVGGLIDQAADWGYPWHDEDFGQTLGHYGVGDYPYLMLPILGPSTARDTVGIIVDTYLDPMTYFVDDEILLARRALEGIDFRSRNIETIEELKRDSIDYYARIRSVYLQRRADEIRNGERTDDRPAPGTSGGGSGKDELSSFE